MLIIYDTNTQDTIDYSSYTNKAIIDLTSGTAKVDLLNNNFASGHSRTDDTFYGIDNAIGTSQADTIIWWSWCKYYYFAGAGLILFFQEAGADTIYGEARR